MGPWVEMVSWTSWKYNRERLYPIQFRTIFREKRLPWNQKSPRTASFVPEPKTRHIPPWQSMPVAFVETVRPIGRQYRIRPVVDCTDDGGAFSDIDTSEPQGDAPQTTSLQ